MTMSTVDSDRKPRPRTLPFLLAACLIALGVALLGSLWTVHASSPAQGEAAFEKVFVLVSLGLSIFALTSLVQFFVLSSRGAQSALDFHAFFIAMASFLGVVPAVIVVISASGIMDAAKAAQLAAPFEARVRERQIDFANKDELVLGSELLDPAALGQSNGIDKAYAAIEQARARQRAMDRYLADEKAKFSESLAQADMDPAMKEQAALSFGAFVSGVAAIDYEVISLREVILNETSIALGILSRSRSWSVENGSIKLSDPASQRAFDQSVATVAELERELMTLLQGQD